MILYTKATSERASKEQGGNRYMRVSLTIDRDEELVLGAHVRDDGDVDVLLSRSTDTGGVELWRDRVKRGMNFEKIQNFGEQHPLFYSSEMKKWRKGERQKGKAIEMVKQALRNNGIDDSTVS